MLLSNVINENICYEHYRFDQYYIPLFDFMIQEMDLPEINFQSTTRMVTERHRNQQTPEP